MDNLLIIDVIEYVEQNISVFHQKRRTPICSRQNIYKLQKQ
ncbi:hypothetical protein Holit_00370 [Hollandina sp. SP2]